MSAIKGLEDFPRLAPVLLPPGTVEWWEHEEAWTEYHKKHREQDAEKIAKRGGFSYWELRDLLGHHPKTYVARKSPCN